MSNISDILKREAIDLGLCPQWTEEWADGSDQQTLIDKYKRGIDFCLERDWPTPEFIKDNFDRALLNRNLIFVDEHIDVKEARSGVYVINGECSGTIRFPQWAAATIYVRHRSKIRIEADGFAKVFIRVYDGAEVDVSQQGGAIAMVYDKRETAQKKKKNQKGNSH